MPQTEARNQPLKTPRRLRSLVSTETLKPIFDRALSLAWQARAAAAAGDQQHAEELRRQMEKVYQEAQELLSKE